MPALLTKIVTRPKARFGLIEGARHGRAVGDVGLDGDGVAAFRLDLGLQRIEPFRAPRHQRDRRAIVGERTGECAPRPLDAPVTSATRFFRSKSSDAFIARPREMGART